MNPMIQETSQIGSSHSQGRNRSGRGRWGGWLKRWSRAAHGSLPGFRQGGEIRDQGIDIRGRQLREGLHRRLARGAGLLGHLLGTGQPHLEDVRGVLVADPVEGGTLEIPDPPEVVAHPALLLVVELLAACRLVLAGQGGAECHAENGYNYRRGALHVPSNPASLERRSES